MIVLSSADPLLRAAVRRVARPDEDVITEPSRAAEALLHGFPRLHVVADRSAPELPARGVPVLHLDRATLAAWEAERLKREVPRPRSEELAVRLRVSLAEITFPVSWVDRTLSELARATGGSLPFAFTAFARHVLEFPRAYTDLGHIAETWRLTSGALTGRFRRRGLESPFLYLRWCRVLAVAELLSRKEVTVAAAADRLGFTSGGNMCRAVRSLTGITPNRLRDPVLRSVLGLSFAGRYLTGADLDAWRAMDDVFRRRGAA